MFWVWFGVVGHRVEAHLVPAGPCSIGRIQPSVGVLHTDPGELTVFLELLGKAIAQPRPVPLSGPLQVTDGQLEWWTPDRADLLKRVVDVAVVGDALPIALAARDWVHTVMNPATLEERNAADLAGTAELMERTAPVLAVAKQAEGDEPLIAAAAKRPSTG